MAGALNSPLTQLHWHEAAAVAEQALGEPLDNSGADHLAAAKALAAQFDARNGTPYQTESLERRLALAERT